VWGVISATEALSLSVWTAVNEEMLPCLFSVACNCNRQGLTTLTLQRWFASVALHHNQSGSVHTISHAAACERSGRLGSGQQFRPASPERECFDPIELSTSRPQ